MPKGIFSLSFFKNRLYILIEKYIEFRLKSILLIKNNLLFFG